MVPQIDPSISVMGKNSQYSKTQYRKKQKKNKRLKKRNFTRNYVCNVEFHSDDSQYESGVVSRSTCDASNAIENNTDR